MIKTCASTPLFAPKLLAAELVTRPKMCSIIFINLKSALKQENGKDYYEKSTLNVTLQKD
jgi:hypothetical protein